MRTGTWRFALIALAAAALLLAVVGCDGYNTGTDTEPGTGTGDQDNGDTGGAGDNTVTAEGFAFSPEVLTVSVGDTVTFTNLDSATHDVEIEGENLGTFGQGESLTWTAEEAGEYAYICTIHPQMTGTIVVE